MSALDDRDRFCDGLLTRVARGDRDALGDLFNSEAGRLIAIARRILRRSELAEEAVQESFIAVWRNAARFDPARGSARAWLTTIVRNRALNMLRDGSRMDLVSEDEIADYHDRSGEADVAYGALGESDALRHCLGQLEDKKRSSILLAYVVGFSHGEIAAKLDAPVGTVKAWIRRGVISLQECLS
ncbi:sigma-70 family RNA polymerase sigma factor [Oryzicola mucosus]|uniref:Sigma-70 family RNA polymerase sigma factor n=1 Tax=Oryzicola mucosus TaxID=2767425 RepID=A0A8J6PV17_9HYPH|nr:sigma-70 family RNA polymerase sigma factor [Oryzicola mucosus]MBD0414527.1 sigma-70 family RNA polymerase sigma factor [Oryzicola mucosus]